MRLRRTFPVIALFCIGILIATSADQALCELSQASETIQLLQAEQANTVSFQQRVYFKSPSGEEVIASIGTYQVESFASIALRLVPFGNKDVFVIKADETRHSEDIGSPVALLVVDEQHLIHVVLLLPEQKGLEAIGSSSSGRSRGMPQLLTPAQIHEALTRKKASLGLQNSGATPGIP